MKIYTKTGDAGFTQLGNGKIIAKDAIHIEALGAVDELNAFLGLVLTHVKNKQTKELEQQILRIQNELILLNAKISLSPIKKNITVRHLEQLEKEIDKMQIVLPPLKKFILLNENKKSAYLQTARTLCRRAERAVVRLFKNNSEYKILLAYLNRLSDWLFVAARYVNHS